MGFRNIKFFAVVSIVFWQNAYAVDPPRPVIGPASPTGASQIASFNPNRTVGQITTAELRAKTALTRAKALEQQYQGYVRDGIIDKVPADVSGAVVQADGSLKAIRQIKESALKSSGDYENASDNTKKAEIARRIETKVAAANGHLGLAQAGVNTANNKKREEAIKAEIERMRLEKERAPSSTSLMPGVGVPAPWSAAPLLNVKSDRRVNDKVLRWGVCRLYRSVEGGMGGLFATIAGVLAVIFSVVGAFKAAWGFLLVAVGAFILRSLVSLFYGGDFNECSATRLNGFDANVENPRDTSGIA